VAATRIVVRPRPVHETNLVGSIEAKSAETLPAVWAIRRTVDTADVSTDAAPGFASVVSVTVTSVTVIDESKGTADIGALVQVRATAPLTTTAAVPAVLTATKIVVLRPAPTPQPVTFSGPIERIEPTMWRVAGRRVQITDTTVIGGAEPKVGWTADVTGALAAGGPVVATSIFVREPDPTPVRFVGTISQLPMPPGWVGVWKITVGTAKLDVQVTAETELVGVPRLGRPVAVTAVRTAGGEIVAKKIVVLGAMTPGV
jgi:hypothetical protein